MSICFGLKNGEASVNVFVRREKDPPDPIIVRLENQMNKHDYEIFGSSVKGFGDDHFSVKRRKN